VIEPSRWLLLDRAMLGGAENAGLQTYPVRFSGKPFIKGRLPKCIKFEEDVGQSSTLKKVASDFRNFASL